MTATRTRKDVEAEVTAKVLGALEQGTVPWAKPWRTAGLLPTSATAGRPYRGVNTWLLSVAAFEAGFESPYWLTYRQAREFGGHVRKGEHGTLVVFWKRLEVKDPEAEDGRKVIPLLRSYVVFNLDQCDEVTMPPRLTPEELAPLEPSEAVEAVLSGYVDGPTMEHRKSDRAYYTPSTDTITLPAMDQWPDEAAYSSTLFHELTHSTGHPSRLDRFERSGEPQHFGSERYAREELVAEMGACLVAAVSGTEYRVDQSASYVASWLRALKDDKSLVIKAAQQAQKAVDLVLGTAVR